MVRYSSISPDLDSGRAVESPSVCSDARTEVTGAPLEATIRRAGRSRLLVSAYAVLFTRYCIATFLSSFFTPVSTALGISGAFNGLIFAAYPLGMALTSVVAPSLIERVGARSAVTFGLVATSLLTLLFGLAPDLLPPSAPPGAAPGARTTTGGPPAVQWLFAAAYLANGLTGALAETACIILVSARFQDKLGTVMASIGTVSGVGCMVGPVVGGVLYDMPEAPAWKFRVPFVVCAAAPLLLVPPLRRTIPPRGREDADTAADEAAHGSGGGGGGGGGGGAEGGGSALRAVLSPSLCLGLSAVALSGTIVATLDPTLSYRLSAPPFRLSASWVSFFFMYSSVVYVVVSVPVGWLVDLFPANGRVFKATTALGFAVLGLTFHLLAPFGLAAPWADRLGLGRAVEARLNSLGAVSGAMVLKGLGSALSNNAVYPDLVLGLPPEDARVQAAVSGLWNAAYSIGWAAGPLMGGLLYEALQTHPLCTGDTALPPFCPAVAAPVVTTAGRVASPTARRRSLRQSLASAAPLDDGVIADEAPAAAAAAAAAAAPGANCSCTWKPQNGFDGFATVVSLVSYAFALLLFVAAALNVTPRAVKAGQQTRERGLLRPNSMSDTTELVELPDSGPGRGAT